MLKNLGQAGWEGGCRESNPATRPPPPPLEMGPLTGKLQWWIFIQMAPNSSVIVLRNSLAGSINSPTAAPPLDLYTGRGFF